jgi:hypothetical protein
MSFKLHISKPCTENWDTMQVVPGGKHCVSCDKNLVDFRSMSDQQIFDVVTLNHNVCGLFNEYQMQTEFTVEKSNAISKMGLAVSFVSLLSFVNPVHAQEKHGNRPRVESLNAAPIITKSDKINSKIQIDTLQIKGRIIDKQTLEIIPFVRVYLKYNNEIRAVSDVEGNFILNVPKVIFDSTVIVKIATLGYRDVEIVVIKDSGNIEVELDEFQRLLGVVIVDQPPTKSQQFFDIFRRKKKKKYWHG